MSAKLISVTKPVVEGVNTAEELIAYAARVSNPENQINNKTAAGLLKYCIRHKHWSIFETAFMTLELKTSRGIAAQVLRHRSFHFQEFSQRYASVMETPPPHQARFQDHKNRQNSLDTVPEDDQTWWATEQEKLYAQSMELYNKALEKGIAKECARFILPLSTPTTIYMSGTIRDWIHYIELRTANGTQREHIDLANACKEIFIKEFPNIAKALDWV
ncbi:thymidylate synthase [Paramecium bursaria Chlorella virus CviKI]|nr:thymidylate synthase [Paramecium bursaria Chlorella virus CviKI]